MAKLMLIGNAADVELTAEDEQIVATCSTHRDWDGTVLGCDWVERYDDLGDASKHAEDHADRGAAQ